LRFFAGLTMPEAAQALGISLATAERYWTYARTWLFAELSDIIPTKKMETSEGFGGTLAWIGRAKNSQESP